MEEIEEQRIISQEIENTLQIGFGDSIDEDELEKELEELARENVQQQLDTITPTPNQLPAQPVTATPAATATTKAKPTRVPAVALTADEEAELAAMDADMVFS